MDFDLINGNAPKGYKTGMFSRIGRALFTKKAQLPEDTVSIREEREIMQNINAARNEWANAQISFDYVNDEDMVDYLIYKIKACQIRYGYFIKKAKEMGIKVETLETTGIAYINDKN